jgi:hypothetical protein
LITIRDDIGKGQVAPIADFDADGRSGSQASTVTRSSDAASDNVTWSLRRDRPRLLIPVGDHPDLPAGGHEEDTTATAEHDRIH